MEEPTKEEFGALLKPIWEVSIKCVVDDAFMGEGSAEEYPNLLILLGVANKVDLDYLKIDSLSLIYGYY